MELTDKRNLGNLLIKYGWRELIIALVEVSED